MGWKRTSWLNCSGARPMVAYRSGSGNQEIRGPTHTVDRSRLSQAQSFVIPCTGSCRSASPGAMHADNGLNLVLMFDTLLIQAHIQLPWRFNSAKAAAYSLKDFGQWATASRIAATASCNCPFKSCHCPT